MNTDKTNFYTFEEKQYVPYKTISLEEIPAKYKNYDVELGPDNHHFLQCKPGTYVYKMDVGQREERAIDRLTIHCMDLESNEESKNTDKFYPLPAIDKAVDANRDPWADKTGKIEGSYEPGFFIGFIKGDVALIDDRGKSHHKGV